MRDIVWVGTARSDAKEFPDGARRRAGFELFRVQLGLEPTDWKPMKSVGPGVREIRIHGETEHRVIYVARIGAVVYVLHAFRKQGRKTPKPDLALARNRFNEVRQTIQNAMKHQKDGK